MCLLSDVACKQTILLLLYMQFLYIPLDERAKCIKSLVAQHVLQIWLHSQLRKTEHNRKIY